MEQSQTPNAKGAELMSNSFGEGYGTRSDEEGFGGTCGGSKQTLHKRDEDEIVHANSPDYDKNQGSIVKEKEAGRHQTNAGS